MSNLKLEIGAGKRKHHGYKNIDIEPYASPDYLGDFRQMKFENVEEIRSHHLLEHFGRKEAIRVLKQWHSWLKPGGKLVVETPDFEGICNCFIKAPIRLWATRDLLIRSAYGSQEADWAFHRDGWYEDKFKEVLPKLGFTIELIKKKHSYIRNENGVRYRLPNILVIAKKMADLNTSSYWNSVWEKWRHDDKKSYLKAMFDRANTPDYWDKIWSNPKRRVEKYSMQRCWWHIQKEKPKTVLEVGCGNGRLLFGVKDIADCYGIDLSSVAIERMKNEYEINGEVLNAYDVDKLDRKFDFVVANHLLEHLYRDEEFLSKVKKIMNDGGTFFCSVPNDMSSPEETEEHVRKYNREMLESLINKVFGNCEIEIVGNHLIGISKKC